MTHHHAAAFFAAVLALSTAAHAKLSRAGEPSVTFTTTGPGGLKINGTTTALTVIDDAQAVVITVPLGKLTTGIGLRDKHMREKYLQTPTYPNASLRVARGDLKFPASGAQAEGDAPGTMTIHGQNHAVTVHYIAKRDGASYAVSGAVHVNMKDYGIEVPSYLGVTVKPGVEITVRFDAKDEA